MCLSRAVLAIDKWLNNSTILQNKHVNLFSLFYNLYQALTVTKMYLKFVWVFKGWDEMCTGQYLKATHSALGIDQIRTSSEQFLALLEAQIYSRD